MSNRPWVAVLALVVSLSNLVYTIANNHIQNKKVRELSYNAQAAQNRPLLRIIGQPEVRQVSYTTRVQVADNKTLDTKLTMSTRIRLKNEGKSNAKIMQYGITDKLTGMPEIRDAIFGKSKIKRIAIEHANDFYKTVDVLPGAEIMLDATGPIQNVSEGVFNIHYFFLYANEFDNVYDTYYWARFASKPFTVDPDGDQEKAKRAIKESIQYVDDHESYKVYSEEESKELLAINDAMTKSMKRK